MQPRTLSEDTLVHDDIRAEIIKHLPSDLQDLIKLRQVDSGWKKFVDKLIVTEINKIIRKYCSLINVEDKDEEVTHAVVRQFILELAQNGYLPFLWQVKDPEVINLLFSFISNELDQQRLGKKSATEFLNMIGPHLQLLDISSIDKKLNFIGVEIDNANFNSANLKGFNLYAITAIDANFSHTILYRSILRNSDVTGAIFKDADLSSADLRGSNITFEQLKEAKSIINIVLTRYDSILQEHIKDIKEIIIAQYKKLINETENISLLMRLYKTGQFDNVLSITKDFFGSYNSEMSGSLSNSSQQVMQAVLEKLVSVVNSMTSNNIKLDIKTVGKLNSFNSSYVTANHYYDKKLQADLQAAIDNNQKMAIIPAAQKMKEAANKGDLIFSTLIQIGASTLSLPEQKEAAMKLINDNILLLKLDSLQSLQGFIIDNAAEGSPLSYLREKQPLIAMFAGKKEYSDDTNTYTTIMHELNKAITREANTDVRKAPRPPKVGPGSMDL